MSFGAFALYLGHNSVVISSVFASVGGIAGYLVGQKVSTSEDSGEGGEA